jgi:hypothetical protein
MLNIKIVGTDKVIKNLAGRYNKVFQNLTRAVESGTRLVQNTAVREHLRGPRPQKLGAVTSNLLGSIQQGMTVEKTPFSILGKVGTNVQYGIYWETGKGVMGKSAPLSPGVAKTMREIYKKVGKGPKTRPFLKPALEQNRKIIINQIKQAVQQGIK